MEEIKLYALRTKDGKFRDKHSWTTDISKTKLYRRIGGARGQITYWANNYPEYGIPDLVEFVITKINIIDDSERVIDVIEKREQEKIKREIYYSEERVKDLELVYVLILNVLNTKQKKNLEVEF